MHCKTEQNGSKREIYIAEVCALPSFSNSLLIPLPGSVRPGGSFAAAQSGVRMSPEITNLLRQNTDLK